jgi:hypothetical protein
VVDLRAGHVAAARTLLEAALARHRSVGNRRSATLCEGQLASVAWHEGDGAGALLQARVAVDLATSVGAPRLVGVSELHVAYACLLLGDLAGSAAAVERARASFSAAHDVLSLADCALLRGQGHLAAGDLGDARRAFDAALEGRAAVHGRTWLEALAGRGLARVLDGDPDGLADLEEATPGLWASDPGTRWIRAQAWRARALARVGRTDAALAVAAEARARLHALGLAATSPGGVALAEVGLD